MNRVFYFKDLIVQRQMGNLRGTAELIVIGKMDSLAIFICINPITLNSKYTERGTSYQN